MKERGNLAPDLDRFEFDPRRLEGVGSPDGGIEVGICSRLFHPCDYGSGSGLSQGRVEVGEGVCYGYSGARGDRQDAPFLRYVGSRFQERLRTTEFHLDPPLLSSVAFRFFSCHGHFFSPGRFASQSRLVRPEAAPFLTSSPSSGNLPEGLKHSALDGMSSRKYSLP